MELQWCLFPLTVLNNRWYIGCYCSRMLLSSSNIPYSEEWFHKQKEITPVLRFGLSGGRTYIVILHITLCLSIRQEQVFIPIQLEFSEFLDKDCLGNSLPMSNFLSYGLPFLVFLHDHIKKKTPIQVPPQPKKMSTPRLRVHTVEQ